jgi:hypothetical protein
MVKSSKWLDPAAWCQITDRWRAMSYTCCRKRLTLQTSQPAKTAT